MRKGTLLSCRTGAGEEACPAAGRQVAHNTEYCAHQALSTGLNFCYPNALLSMARESGGDAFRKILLVANTGWYLYNFRLPLARRLRLEGFEVVLVSPPDSYVGRLRAEGFRCIGLDQLSRRGVNPFLEVFALWELIRLYWREKPRAVHHFTIKCVLYGTIAAKLTGVRSVVNAVTGLGHIFLGRRLVTRLLRPPVRWLYRRILKARRGHVVFQNPDDLNAFVEARLVAPEKTVIIRSSGVDVARFSPRPGAPDLPADRTPTVLFVGRLIKEKGIHDFVEAARLIKAERGVCFRVAGEIDPGNPSSLTVEQVEEWRREGAVDLLGHVDSIDEVIALADVVVLPSYREGTPRVLLEAAAMGKPLVATDVPGCREVVLPGHNGLLAEVENPQSLANAISQLLENPHLAHEMGLAGRELVESEFCSHKVVERTLDVYAAMGIVA
jgi:glycosyltransferase involved in cell wall biosynthesis